MSSGTLDGEFPGIRRTAHVSNCDLWSTGSLESYLSPVIFPPFLRNNDPLPTERAFATLTKLGIMVSRAEAVERFTNYPGIAELTNHPKLVGLRNDPEIAELLQSQSYFRLLRHDKIVALANDPIFAAEIKKLEFDKALDFALSAENDAPPQ